MRLNPVVITLIGTVSFFSFRASAGQNQAVAPINIDLFNPQLNEKRITEISLNNITDWLGRPSAIRSNEDKAFGVDIYHHDRGLVFNVMYQEEDKQQHCQYVSVYLSKVWDVKFSRFFLPYDGIISKNLDGSWKVSQLKAEFDDFQMADYQNDERMKQIQSLRDILNFDEMCEHILTTSRIDMKNGTSHITVIHEPNTKFLEWLNVSNVYPKTQENTEMSTAPSSITPGTKRQKPESTSPLKPR
jgi:hypothetical protein